MDKNRVYVIAEMACSHEGKEELGCKIIDASGESGADAIQFQIWSLPDMVVPHHPDYELLTRIELPRDTWTRLLEHSRSRFPKMEIIACVYEPASVDFAESIGVDAYKIHSSDVSNPLLLEHVARTGKRVDLSVGASTLDEIQTALDVIRSASNSEIWMMYGIQNFPTPTDAIHLDYMMKLAHLFELPIGYQDHSDGASEAAFWLPATAVGMGVDILEKHITHDRDFKGVDHEAALNPDEFSRFVAMVRELERARGISVPKKFTPEEESYRKNSKKSIVASRNVPTDKPLEVSDLLYMRADQLGLPPAHVSRLLGRQVKHPVQAFQLITEADLV